MSTLAGAVGLDVADWWEASAEGYLRHVPKARILAAVEQAAMPAEAATLGKLKKDALVAKAETLLAGTRWLQLVSSGLGTKRRSGARRPLVAAFEVCPEGHHLRQHGARVWKGRRRPCPRA